MGVFSYFVVVNVSVVYGVVFIRAAYDRPMSGAQAQRETLRLTTQDSLRYRKPMVRKQVEVLKPITMKVGRFKVVEMNASLEYGSFVVNQIVALLVSFS